jgi:hypothetical protein
MPLTNAQKQARWRERHIARRRLAARVSNLLLRKSGSDDQIAEIAGLLRQFFNREGLRRLCRKIREIEEPTKSELNARSNKRAKDWLDLWLRDHPGRTAADHDRVSDDEMHEWRVAKNKAASKAEKRAWQRDHPGQEYPDPAHPCFLTDRQYTDVQRWQRQRARKQARATKPDAGK